MKTVSSTTLPDIYFLPEWGHVYGPQDKGEAKIFEFKNSLGHIYYQFILRPIPLQAGGMTYYDTITPFGMSGPIILSYTAGKKSELITLFNQAFQEYCEANNIVAEYIRFSPWLQNLKDFEQLYAIDKRGITLSIDLTVRDFFMEEFKSSTRQQIRKALKNNVELAYDYTGATLSEFMRLYNIMAKRNNIPNYYRFTEELLMDSFRHLKGKQFIIYAKHEGEYVSAALFLHHENQLHYHLAANDPQYFNLAANSLIIHEACGWGVSHGQKILHLGGASSDQLFRFKKGFTKTEPMEILTGKKVRNPVVYRLLTEQRGHQKEIINPSYFPLYRG